MKIAIFGSGGLGAYYGTRFAEAGHHVSFIARGEHLLRMRESGLILHSPLGDAHLHPVSVTDAPSDVGPQDLILVAVKTTQLEDAARAMLPMMTADTIVVPFLNGIEAPDVLARVLGEQQVLGGLSRIFSKIEAPGVIRHFNDSAYVEFGELDGASSTRCDELKAAFEQTGVEASISDDIRLNLWRKLILVSSWGGLGAISKSTMGELRKHPESRQLITACANESKRVAEAEGHRFPDDLIENLWQFYDALPDQASTSLSRDWLADKPSELDAWHGVIIRLADKHGIDVPHHRFIYNTMLPAERRSGR